MPVDQDTLKRLVDRGLIQPQTAQLAGGFDSVEEVDTDLIPQQPEPTQPVESPSTVQPATTPLEAPQQPTPTSTGLGTPEAITPALEDTTTPNQPVMVPTVTGQTITTSTTEKQATQGLIDAQENMRAAFEGQKQAAQELADVTKAKAVEEFNLAQEQTRILEESDQARKEIADQGQEELESRLSAIDNKVADLSEMKYEGFWQDKSTGTKLLAALAVGLGAAGSAMTGGKNTALSIINKAMDDDFKVFQARTARKIKAIEQSRASFDTKQKLIQQELDNQDAYKVGQITQLKSKLSELSAKYKGPEAQAQAAQMMGKLDQELAKQTADIQSKLTNTVTTQVNKQIANVKVDPKTGEVVRSAPSFKDEQALRKEVKADPVIKEATTTLSNVAKADRAMDLVRKGDAGALGTVTTIVASAVQSGVLTDQDIARASGAPLGVVRQGLDAIDKWLINQPPETQVKTLESLLVTARESATVQLDERLGFYRGVAEDGGFNVERIIPPAPKQRSQVKAPNPAPYGNRVTQGGKVYVWDGVNYKEEQ